MCFNKQSYDAFKHLVWINKIKTKWIEQSQEFVFDYKQYLSTRSFKNMMDELKTIYDGVEYLKEALPKMIPTPATDNINDGVFDKLINISLGRLERLEKMIDFCKKEKLHEDYPGCLRHKNTGNVHRCKEVDYYGEKYYQTPQGDIHSLFPPHNWLGEYIEDTGELIFDNY